MILPQHSPAIRLPVERTVKVCIVDPQREDFDSLRNDPRMRHVQLEFLSSGRGALRQAQRENVDLWVINVALPDMSGCDLCQMLKSRDGKAVVYLLTDAYRAEEERAAWLAGAVLFRPKPIDPAWFDRLTDVPAVSRAV